MTETELDKVGISLEELSYQMEEQELEQNGGETEETDTSSLLLFHKY